MERVPAVSSSMKIQNQVFFGVFFILFFEFANVFLNECFFLQKMKSGDLGNYVFITNFTPFAQFLVIKTSKIVMLRDSQISQI